MQDAGQLAYACPATLVAQNSERYYTTRLLKFNSFGHFVGPSVFNLSGGPATFHGRKIKARANLAWHFGIE